MSPSCSAMPCCICTFCARFIKPVSPCKRFPPSQSTDISSSGFLSWPTAVLRTMTTTIRFSSSLRRMWHGCGIVIAWLPCDIKPTATRSLARLSRLQNSFVFNTTLTNKAQKRFGLNSWELNYPEQPFFLQKTKDDGVGQEDKHKDVQEVDGFDLLGSATRQSMFLWQVSQPRFEDVAFLQEGVQKYAQFLALESESNKFLLVPTYQIDKRAPSILSLSLQDNLIPTIEFLARV